MIIELLCTSHNESNNIRTCASRPASAKLIRLVHTFKTGLTGMQLQSKLTGNIGHFQRRISVTMATDPRDWGESI